MIWCSGQRNPINPLCKAEAEAKRKKLERICVCGSDGKACDGGEASEGSRKGENRRDLRNKFCGTVSKGPPREKRGLEDFP